MHLRVLDIIIIDSTDCWGFRCQAPKNAHSKPLLMRFPQKLKETFQPDHIERSQAVFGMNHSKQGLT